MQELIDRGARDAPLRADLLALQVALLKARHHVGFGDAEHLRDLRRRQQLRLLARPRRAAAAAGAETAGVACGPMMPPD